MRSLLKGGGKIDEIAESKETESGERVRKQFKEKNGEQHQKNGKEGTNAEEKKKKR